MNPKKISIWGSTGSIGTQTLDVVSQQPGRFRIHTLTGHSNIPLLLEQAKQFHPEYVIVTGQIDIKAYREAFRALGVSLYAGRDALLDAASGGEAEIVVNALVGAVGLEATLKAIDAGTDIAIANKEVLVMAGEIVTARAREKGVKLLPIDSEHSAVFQSLHGEPREAVKRIILTASGGPFLNRDIGSFQSITVEEALKHPNWAMGKKITIDSATMMNKGLEIIEARWLFDVPPEKIEVVIHPQSIIHSMVEYQDGSLKAQLGRPDMRVPIAYALSFPDRWPGNYGSMDFSKLCEFSFAPPDEAKFPALRLAKEALKTGGTAPAVFNAADEAAVDLFLQRKISFPEISSLVEAALEKHAPVQHPNLEQIMETDAWARQYTYDKR